MSSAVGCPGDAGQLAVDRLERGDDDLLALGELEDRLLHRPHFVRSANLPGVGVGRPAVSCRTTSACDASQ